MDFREAMDDELESVYVAWGYREKPKDDGIDFDEDWRGSELPNYPWNW